MTAALSAFQQVFPDAPQGKALERLGVVQQRLSVAASPSSATLAPRATLTALLPNALAGFAAAQPIEDAPDRAGDVAVRIVSRAYKAGAREAFVRVIDAAQAPSFRTPLVEQLVQVGGEHQGFAHGRLVGGYPVVAVYFQKTQSSRATAIIGRRYLIDIRVSHAKSPYDAQEILAAMGVSRLAPPDDAGVAR